MATAPRESKKDEDNQLQIFQAFRNLGDLAYDRRMPSLKPVLRDVSPILGRNPQFKSGWSYEAV